MRARACVYTCRCVRVQDERVVGVVAARSATNAHRRPYDPDVTPRKIVCRNRKPSSATGNKREPFTTFGHRNTSRRYTTFRFGFRLSQVVVVQNFLSFDRRTYTPRPAVYEKSPVVRLLNVSAFVRRNSIQEQPFATGQSTEPDVIVFRTGPKIAGPLANLFLGP